MANSKCIKCKHLKSQGHRNQYDKISPLSKHEKRGKLEAKSLIRELGKLFVSGMLPLLCQLHLLSQEGALIDELLSSFHYSPTPRQEHNSFFCTPY